MHMTGTTDWKVLRQMFLQHELDLLYGLSWEPATILDAGKIENEALQVSKIWLSCMHCTGMCSLKAFFYSLVEHIVLDAIHCLFCVASACASPGVIRPYCSALLVGVIESFSM